MAEPEIYFLRVSKPESLRSSVAGWVSPELSFLGSQTGTFSLSPHGLSSVQCIPGISLSLLISHCSYWIRVPSSFNLITSLEALSPNTVGWGEGIGTRSPSYDF